MKYPTPHWRAQRPGYFELNGEPLNIICRSLGKIPCPSGRIVVKDSGGFSRLDQRAITVIPGEYEVTVTCVEQGSLSLLAYISLEFGHGETKNFKPLTPTHKNETTRDLRKEQRYGFRNRTGYGMLIDEDILKTQLPVDDEHCYSLLCYWQNQLEDAPSDWEGHQFTLGLDTQSKNMLFFKTKAMQGLTRLWGEFDQIGMLLRMHIDLQTVERLYRLAEQ